MKKILIIIWREFITRVRTRAFILSTLLTPIGFALISVIPAISATNVEKESYQVWVIDQSGFILPELKKDDYLSFKASTLSLESQKEVLGDKEFILLIPEIPDHRANPNFSVISNSKISLQIQAKVIERGNQAWRKRRMDVRGISEADSDFIREKPTWSIDEGEDNAGAIVSTIAGTIMSLIIYTMLAIYGSIISRGVIEEKTNRIIELMASTVKPFQLLMGKVIGIGMVGLMQFTIWAFMFLGITFTLSLILVGAGNVPDPGAMEGIAGAGGGGSMEIDPEIFSQIGSVFSVGNILLFGFYFLGGFLLYGSLFAAVGSAVDQDSDTQTLTLPILLPLIIPMLVISNLIQNPSGMLSKVFSIVPFFSPVTMMLRKVGSEVPAWELALSMILLVLSFIGSVWVAGRIYRVGILMYGKKVTFRELWRWIRHY